MEEAALGVLHFDRSFKRKDALGSALTVQWNSIVGKAVQASSCRAQHEQTGQRWKVFTGQRDNSTA